MKAVNWNQPDDDFTKMFWDQNLLQFWIDTEIPLSEDKMSWMELSDTEKEVYKKVLGGLTLLDTEQGGIGMPLISQNLEGLQQKSVLGFMGAMEHIHAKSYSSIFSTLCTTEEINEIFQWVEENEYLQKKANIISTYYENINTKLDQYLAMVSSVFLESFLFYSGFYYPLFLAGQGKLVHSGEIINLIIRDESIHGVYIGLLAQEVYRELSAEEKQEADLKVSQLLQELYLNEENYTDELYGPLGIQEDVKQFSRYNANKALMNLGLEAAFPDEEINAIVLNGLNTNTKNHDFFSTKGNGYIKTLNVEKLTDDDFVFEV
ncbi:class 1b ribonucleoside-diphosphate reductase subunit beta [Chengkuizengella axinellae]|uniref:Ribonucleoside-diphosphate reductase subunit beta n=1 Tax=Chengkuizengella axinellae TaxID=3064388 RepID=A0ABT9IZG5_9BACL|nr:class 1b ribonucleoside-diphosphate reductase subunit beta [Chengkuizengella sp. 2205SS18-9]MDP5274184.1 class 1b ribonucleoside-diphosphate reductase subunit beta [Chengkuizengella sp. 2205SS18-9]